MGQALFLYEGDSDAPACDREFALTVSLFAEDDRTRDLMAEDARAAGLRVRGSRALESLLEAEGGVLGDVVLVDCPVLGAERLAALVRLDERCARAGSRLVVSTSAAALDDVFGCLDRSRPQILVGASRAERMVALGCALTVRPGHRVRELDEDERVLLLRLTEQVGRLAEQLDTMPPSGLSPVTAKAPAVGGSERHGLGQSDNERDLIRKPRAPLPDPRLVQRILRQRRLRARYFDADLFADPAWDILLDLTAARAEHRRVCVTSLCVAAAVPPTTALRWIAQMEESGLLERVPDETDRRRSFIALSDRAAEAMARYFDELGSDAARMI